MKTKPESQGFHPESAWFWEGNVQSALANFLKTSGWTIISMADTATRAPGVDLLARKDGRSLAIEVKGYPSTMYAAGPLKGQPKPTQPSTQARHWFSQAILSSMLMRQERPDAEVWIALPDFPRYRTLIDRIVSFLSAISVGVFLIRQDETVSELIGSAAQSA